jgi:hypothetical protein
VAMRAGGLPPDLCHAPDVRALPAPSDLGRGPSEVLERTSIRTFSRQRYGAGDRSVSALRMASAR